MEKTRASLETLKELLQNAAHFLIVMQDNPDPDSIAAALALRELVHHLGNVSCSITHGGSVGRAENRALVKYLNLNLRNLQGLDWRRFDRIAMVDTQPGTGNNSLPKEVIPDIVIDHHPLRRASRQVLLHDIRSNYGATATILLEYLTQANITPTTPLATAIMYAIRSDTQDLGMQASSADIQAIQNLYPLANKRMLSEIQRGSVQRDYFTMLTAALNQARIYGYCIITSLDEITNCDMISEVADLLLRDDEVSWTLCYGFCREKMWLSLRTSESGKRAEKVMKRLVARRGTGGGHETMAGGQIPLKKKTKAERNHLEKVIRDKFLKLLGISGNLGKKLIT